MKKIIFAIIVLVVGITTIFYNLPQKKLYADDNVNHLTTFSIATDKVAEDFILDNDITISQEFVSVNNFSGTFDGNGHTITISTSTFVPLFTNTNGAIIKNLKVIKNLSVDATTISSPTAGVVVNKAENTLIENCDIQLNSGNCQIQPNCSSNVGIIAGQLTSGSKIQNCVVSGKLTVVQTNVNASQTFVGAVCGRQTNSQINYVIAKVNISLQHENEDECITNMKTGSFVGYVEGQTSAITNCVCLAFDSLSPLIIGSGTSTKGVFTGGITSEISQIPNSGSINKLVAITAVPYYVLGDENNSFIVNENYKIQSEIGNYNTDTPYKTDWWTNGKPWDTNSIWVSKSDEHGDNYFTLQAFQTFTLQVENNRYFTMEIAKKGEDSGEDPLITTLNYGETATVSVKFEKIKETNHLYSFFFKIKNLYLNSSSNVISSIVPSPSENVYSWDITNIDANKEGTYGIQLENNYYNIEFNAPRNPSDILMGKVNRLTNAPVETITEKVSYGITYNYESQAETYFVCNGWQIGENALELSNKITNSTFSFTFNEEDHFTMEKLLNVSNYAEYQVTSYNESTVEPLMVVDAVFANNVCNLEFVIELDNVESEENYEVIVKIDEATLAYVNNKYTYKITLNTDVVVKIDNLPAEYVFAGIKDDTGVEYELSNTGTFNFNQSANDGETNVTKTFTIAFTTLPPEENNSWIWWVVAGGVVVLAGVVVLIVFAVKNRDYSYRNYY